jgi:hypothetical protein
MHTQNTSALLAGNRLHRQRELRAAMLRVVSDFKARPEPRGAWDEIARIDRPTKRFDLIQQPIRAAVAQGAPTDRVVDFYVALMTDALAAAPNGGLAFDLNACVLRALRENADAMEAWARAKVTRCPLDEERAIRESEESAAADYLVAATYRARLAKRTG